MVRIERNRLSAAFLLLAFIVHALIPAGFMPGRQGLALCHGSQVFVSADRAAPASSGLPGLSQERQLPDSGGGAKLKIGHCAFASAGHAAALLPVYSLLLLSESGHRLRRHEPDVQHDTARVAVRLARGPPELA